MSNPMTTSASVDVDGVRIHYATAGAPPLRLCC